MHETTTTPDIRRRTTAITRWFLLTGNRFLVSLLVLAWIGGAFAVAGALGLATVTAPTRVLWYLNGTVNGLLTLIPISIGVNQIVLSHEFGSIQDLYQRREKVTEFRKRVEERTDATVSSPDASALFHALLTDVSDTARALERERDRSPEGERTTDDVGTALRSLGDQADRANDELEARDSDMLRTLIVMLGYDDSRSFNDVRRLRGESSDLDAETGEKLQRIEEILMEIDAARQYVKTIVVERQLARLSRYLVYTGISAVTIAVLGIFTYRDIAGVTIPHLLLVGAAGGLVVASLVPLVVLAAYILRVATIARQTASYGPFVPGSGR